MGESKPERVPVVCEECRFYVGSLTQNARGRLMEFVHANDSNCKHPPAATCPYLLMAFSKVRAATRKANPQNALAAFPEAEKTRARGVAAVQDHMKLPHPSGGRRPHRLSTSPSWRIVRPCIGITLSQPFWLELTTVVSVVFTKSRGVNQNHDAVPSISVRTARNICRPAES